MAAEIALRLAAGEPSNAVCRDPATPSKGAAPRGLHPGSGQALAEAQACALSWLRA